MADAQDPSSAGDGRFTTAQWSLVPIRYTSKLPLVGGVMMTVAVAVAAGPTFPRSLVSVTLKVSVPLLSVVTLIPVTFCVAEVTLPLPVTPGAPGPPVLVTV
jgi:hypothetical protein